MTTKIVVCAAAQPPIPTTDYTADVCSCMIPVDVLNGLAKIFGCPISNDCSADMQWIAHADLRACVLGVAYGLTITTYVRMRRPIRLIHDIRRCRRLNLGGEGFVCRATRARTPDYIRTALALVTTTYSRKPTLYASVEPFGEHGLAIHHG
jgi:hypothetical protein